MNGRFESLLVADRRSRMPPSPCVTLIARALHVATVMLPADAAQAARVAAAARERASPALLVPAECVVDRWQTIMVPLSGPEAGADALAFAAELAHALDMQVYAAVVPEPRMGYADAPYHEYAYQLEEFVARALPDASAEVSATVRGVLVGEGSLSLAESARADLVVAGTELADLADLVVGLACPVLLVPPAAAPAFRLKVGDAFE